MASGDTKTEAMLNVLGNGGSGDEFRGCCNTKTQTYILDAIDRINSLTPGGTSDFDELTNRPKYNGTTMTSSTDIPASPTVVQTTGTSETDVMSQDATTSMVFADPTVKEQVRIGKLSVSKGPKSIAIGSEAKVDSTAHTQSISIGSEAKSSNGFSTAIGSHADAGYYGVALGAWAKATRNGEVNIGTGSQTTSGYNSSNYRVIGGVYDGQDAHDAATVGQALGTDESYTIATGDWTALSASSPYTYQATATATYTIGNSTIAELLNDTPVTFANYGFAIGAIAGQTVTIYSIGQPSASVTLKVNYKG